MKSVIKAQAEQIKKLQDTNDLFAKTITRFSQEMVALEPSRLAMLGTIQTLEDNLAEYVTWLEISRDANGALNKYAETLTAKVAQVTQERDAHKEMIRKISEGQNPVHVLTQGMSMVIELQQHIATARRTLVEVRTEMDQLKAQVIEVVRTERQQVWEEAAKMVEGGRFLHDESPEAKWAYMIAKLCREQARKEAQP